VDLPRIVFVSYTADWTGPTNSLLLLLRHLRSRYEMSVLAPGTGAFTEMLADEGVRSHSVPELGIRSIPRMRTLFRETGVDLVYGNNTGGGSRNALVAAKSAGLPFVCHLRGMAITRSPVHLQFLRFADATVAVSEATAAAHRAYMGSRPCHVIYNGVDLSRWTVGREEGREMLLQEMGIPADVPVATSVAHLNQRKGQHHAVEAMARVVRSVPEARLILVGALDRDPGYVDDLRRRIQGAGLQDRVIIAGFRRDVARILAGADLYVHTALADPHPRAVLEAMSADLPVAAFAVDGVAETVLDGETGLLVPAADPAALARAMTRLLRPVDRSRDMGRAGKRRVEERFTADVTAREVGDVLASVLGHGSSAGTPAGDLRGAA
jgi:glycosyltransferase involved in cell wall biosynthesis